MTSGRVISFINMKGGVGKTTLTINLAYTLLKEFNKKVLLIDMDPQFNATQALFTKYKSIQEYETVVSEKKTILNLLKQTTHHITDGEQTTEFPEVIINLESSDMGKFDLIPGDLNLTTFESSDRGAEKLLKKSVDKLKPYYDYILIDTPATYSVYGQTALLASDYYIVPVLPDTFASLGHDLLENKVQKDLVLEGTNLQKLGVVITLSKMGKAKRSAIIELFNDVKFDTELYENEHIRTGNIENFIYDMDSTRENIIELTDEFITKINEVEGNG